MTASDNPFVHRMELERRDKVQIFLMSITLAPIRFVLAFGLLLIAWLMGALFTLGASSDFSHPISPTRQRLYNTLRRTGRLILFFLGITIEQRGERVSSARAPILIGCPHQSYLDILLWFVSGDLPAAMTKQENLKLPIFGTLFRAVQPVFVQRTDAKSRASALCRLRERVSSSQNWPQVIMFPEGTCHRPDRLISFKKGAFAVGVPVQPLLATFRHPRFDYTTWTEVSESGLWLVWVALCQLRTLVTVEYLPVYEPSQEEREDPGLYAENVRRHLAAHLGVECSDHSYEDRQLMRAARKLGFSEEHAAVEFVGLRSRHRQVTYERCRSLLAEFAAMTSQHDARCGDVARRLRLPADYPPLRALFARYDVTKTGRVGFSDYVRGRLRVDEESAAIVTYNDDDVTSEEARPVVERLRELDAPSGGEQLVRSELLVMLEWCRQH